MRKKHLSPTLYSANGKKAAGMEAIMLPRGNQTPPREKTPLADMN